MPTNHDRVHRRGDTLFFLDAVFHDVITQAVFTVPVTNPPTQPPSGSAPLNLTGCVLWFTVKAHVQDADARAIMRADSAALGGIVITSPLIGAFSVTAPPITTSQFPDGDVDLVYDIQLRDATGNVFTVEYGLITVQPDVTRVMA